jgi:hypothetical protein
VVEIEKFSVNQKEENFLGFLVSGRRLIMAPGKCEAMTTLPIPTIQKEVQIFLGLWNFILGFIKGYTPIVTLITHTNKSIGRLLSLGK